MKIDCILLAAGSGKRFGGKKQFLYLKGKRVIDYSLEVIGKVREIDRVFVVLSKEDMDIELKADKPIIKVEGGKERQDSVFHALKAIDESDIVVIHDSARPFVDVSMFEEAIANVKEGGCDGSITAYKAVDTIKKVADGIVVETLNRDEIYIVQTPQAFKFKNLYNAHLYAREKGIHATDDASLMELFKYKICTNQGSFYNFKITTPEDLRLIQILHSVA